MFRWVPGTDTSVKGWKLEKYGVYVLSKQSCDHRKHSLYYDLLTRLFLL